MKRAIVRRLTAGISLLAFVVAGTGWAQEAAYPTQSIKLIVGFPAGGPTDVAARMIAEGVGKAFGQPVIVDNRPGANATIATGAVARSKPDGYSALMAATNHTINAVLYKDLPYDSEKAFAPVAAVAVAPTVLVVNNDLPARNYAEFLKLVKGNPDKYSYASAGSGGTPHLSAEMFKQMTGTSLMHVPYKGAAPAVTDLMAGHVQVYFATLGSVLPQIKAGKMRALAVASPTRSPLLPDVPTFEESGLSGFRLDSWYGVMLPAGTPEPIVKKLNVEIQKVVRTPEYAAKLASSGLLPVTDSGPEAFTMQIREEIRTFRELVKSANLKVD
jgi:tripartite-type tricarboxylate transporter receptor subunit TctC